jgi:hypothetical protein
MRKNTVPQIKVVLQGAEFDFVIDEALKIIFDLN